MTQWQSQRHLSRLDRVLAGFDDWWRGDAQQQQQQQQEGQSAAAPASSAEAAQSAHNPASSAAPASSAEAAQSAHNPASSAAPASSAEAAQSAHNPASSATSASSAEAAQSTHNSASSAARPAPQPAQPPAELSPQERRYSGALMRVNHSGEVCAQALYLGQGLVARRSALRDMLRQSAREEEDHLHWCRERLQALGTHPSRLNGAWYVCSWGLGAAAGLGGERLSLGFLAATEDRVCVHLRRHLRRLPVADSESRAVLMRMLEEESGHGARALAAGGYAFPLPVRLAMGATARLMTGLSYWL